MISPLLKILISEEIGQSFYENKNSLINVKPTASIHEESMVGYRDLLTIFK